MTIIPPGPQASPQRGARSAAAAGDRRAEAPRASFAELFRSLGDSGLHGNGNSLPGPLPPQVQFQSHGRAFSAEVTIADDAIRFDARPIVAPTSLGDASTIAFAGADALEAVVALEANEPPDRLLLEGVSAVAENRRGAQDLESERSAPAAGKRDALATPARLAASLAGQPARAASPAQAPARTGAEETAAARRVQNPVNAARHPPASLALLPNEVIVTLHGLSLTSGERDELARDVQDLLRQSGLSTRHIRIQTNSRNSRSWP